MEREQQAELDARETVNRYFTEVAENDLLNVPGLLPLREKLLSGALDYYQQYLEDNSDDPKVVDEIELAYVRVRHQQVLQSKIIFRQSGASNAVR